MLRVSSSTFVRRLWSTNRCVHIARPWWYSDPSAQRNSVPTDDHSDEIARNAQLFDDDNDDDDHHRRQHQYDTPEDDDDDDNNEMDRHGVQSANELVDQSTDHQKWLKRRLSASLWSSGFVERLQGHWRPPKHTPLSDKTYAQEWFRHLSARGNDYMKETRVVHFWPTYHRLQRAFERWEIDHNVVWPSELVSADETIQRAITPSIRQYLSHFPHRHTKYYRLRRMISQLLPLGRVSQHNNVSVYDNGGDAFRAIWKAIEEAKESIQYETYILSADEIGIKTMTLLSDAALRGVDVTLIYDDFGSAAISSDINLHLEMMRRRGVNVHVFNPILTQPQKWRRLNAAFRTHRKLAIIDHRIAFCGGMNTTSDYADKAVGGTGKFRDSHFRFEGPAAEHFYAVFLDSLHEATGDDTLHEADQHRDFLENVTDATPDNWTMTWVRLRNSLWRHTPLIRLLSRHRRGDPPSSSSTSSPSTFIHSLEPGGCFVQVLESNTWKKRYSAQRSFVAAISNSSTECLICNPYFCPPDRIRRAVLRAARRGVDVRVLTTGFESSDVSFMHFASQHIYAALLRNGIEVYEYKSRKLHAKTCVIDGVVSVVGSSNLELWSHDRTLEVNVAVWDVGVGRTIRQQFFRDIQDNSTQITYDMLQQRSWYQKLLHASCYYGYLALHLIFGRFNSVVMSVLRPAAPSSSSSSSSSSSNK